MTPDPGHAFALFALAMAADALIAWPAPARWLEAPRAGAERLANAIEKRLNRERRGVAARRLRGALVTVSFALAGFGLGSAAAALARALAYGEAVDLVLLLTLVGPRRLYAALRHAGGDAAFRRLAPDDPPRGDELARNRAAILAAALRFCDRLTAPLFWYALFGLPALGAYAGVRAAALACGHVTARLEPFGAAALRLGAVLDLLPAPLAGLVLGLAAAFVPGARPLAALSAGLRDGPRHPLAPALFSAGGAMAAALGLALGGRYRIAGEPALRPEVGAGGRLRAETADLARAAQLFAVACLILAGLCGGAALALAPR